MASVSPVLPADFCGTIPESTGSICTKLNALWSLANKVCEFFTWFLTADGHLSEEGADLFAGVAVPVGGIIFWPMDLAPTGFLTANGATVSRTTYANLFAVYGTKYGAGDGTSTFGLPNIQRRFPFGASGSNVAGSTGGAETVTLVAGNIPESAITYKTGVTKILAKVDTGGTSSPAVSGSWSDLTADQIFDNVGEETPDVVDILPPYFSGNWAIKT